MTHLVIGLYAEGGIVGIWANLEYDGYALEGVIHDAMKVNAYDALFLVMPEVKIIRPKRLLIFTNDQALVKMFSRPIRLEFDHYPLLRHLVRYNKWEFTAVDGSKLRRAKEEWQKFNR